MHQLLLCALLVHSAWGQGAPGDFELNDCTVSSVNEEVMLFDSRAYRMAYTTNWIFVDYDANTDARVSSCDVCHHVQTLPPPFSKLAQHSVLQLPLPIIFWESLGWGEKALSFSIYYSCALAAQ